MAFKTMQQLVSDVQVALYQASGSNVQLYSQEVLMQQIQNGFDHIFTKQWWPQFRKRETVTLDGVNGYPATPLQHITSYEDIRYVFPENSQRPLPVLAMGHNPLGNYLNTGDRPRMIEGDADKVFRIIPYTATGTVHVVGRKRPAAFLFTDVVPMDPTVLLHFAAWSYLSDDGSNPESTLKHQTLFEARLKQLEADTFNEPIMLDPWMDRIPDQWMEGRPW